MIMSQFTTTLLYYDDQNGLFRCQQPQMAINGSCEEAQVQILSPCLAQTILCGCIEAKISNYLPNYSGQELHYNAG